ncbi:MAG: acyltransferase family protein [Bacteroidota bacterium]
MEKHIEKINENVNKRLLSLDFFRGFTMFILVGSGLWGVMRESDVGWISEIGWQFEHRYWHGLTLWDFVEPFFMFIVGVAIPFSVLKRLERGEQWGDLVKHALKRSLILFILGIAIYSIGAGRPVFRLWNVLTQLSVTYLVAFLLMNKSIKLQLIVSFSLLVVTELLYRLWPVEGFNQPFFADHNFGSWVDLKLMGVLEGDHWVAFNVVPTTAFAIWGVIAGLLLRSDKSDSQKLKTLILFGVVGIIAGFLLDPITPMIKRIGTSSIIIETGGWCLVALAFSYWMVDLKKVHKVPKFFAIVGMNPLFIYLFAQIGGTSFLDHLVQPFAYTLFFWADEAVMAYAVEILTWFSLWYLCYWLYKHKILIKI